MKTTTLNAGESQPDVIISFPGGEWSTIWTFTPKTEEAQNWIAENVEAPPDYMLSGRLGSLGFHADHRPARDIAQGMAADGLLVHDEHGRTLRSR
jgi:hypothetical protein